MLDMEALVGLKHVRSWHSCSGAQEDNPMDGPNIVMAIFNCKADDEDELAFKASGPILRETILSGLRAEGRHHHSGAARALVRVVGGLSGRRCATATPDFIALMHA